MLIEDHPVVAEGLRKMLSESSFSAKILVFTTGGEGLEALELFQPDILLLDINLPDISGIELCGRISKKWPGIRIIALSSSSSKTVIGKMLEHGAKGYLLKDSDSQEILRAVSAVSRGEVYINEQVGSILSGREKSETLLLSAREKQVLKFISDGFTNNEIAEKMFISPLTVDSHRKNMLLKLGAKNTAALVKIAMLNGLIDN